MGELSKNFPKEEPSGSPSARSIEVRERGRATEAGRSATDEVKNVASNVANQAKELVSNQVTRKASRSADELGDVAHALRRTKDELHGNLAAPYVDKAADQLERLSNFLRNADATEVMHGVEKFARREPLLFLGGAFALGILGARFLKSSAHHTGGFQSMGRPPTERYREQGQWEQRSPYGGQSTSQGEWPTGMEGGQS